MEFKSFYSSSTLHLKRSKIRELLKMSNIPGIISFAGGMPDSNSLPFEEVKIIINEWNYEKARIALQYGTTKGYVPLLDMIKDRMKKNKRIDMNNQDIIVTTGSQQALSMISKLFLDPDDYVIVEIPSFIGAIASIYSFMGKIEGVIIDDEGIIIEKLIEKIEELYKRNKNVKFIYTIPNFNNPSGSTLSIERRRKLIEVSEKYNIPIIEDDPYGDLYFYGDDKNYMPIKSMDKKDNVLYLGTFSKVLSPGLRVGWVVANKDLITKLELQKQSIDACTPTFSQLIAYDYMEKGYIDSYIEKARSIYKEKRNAVLKNLKDYMPEGITWTKPKGGFFIWIHLPEALNSEDVFKEAIKNNVAFVTGDAFLPEGYPNNYIRISYSNLPVSKLNKGIEILSNVIKKMMK